VDLPRPRVVDMLADAGFNALKREILHELRAEGGH
jgi:hypothetical protein